MFVIVTKFFLISSNSAIIPLNPAHLPQASFKNHMRIVQPKQLQLGEVDIADIKFDPRSRDDIPQLLRGLQHLYLDEAIREKIFLILKKLVPAEINEDNGRPGMFLWKVLVMGVLRVNLNWDYDRLLEMVNNHKTIRQVLGHGIRDDEDTYKLQTLKDNVSLLTPDILDDINQIVVAAGHQVVKKKEEETLKGRCDSFVMETHVHFPTDINLLWDAVRKTVKLTASLSDDCGLTLWRQSEFNLRQIKKLYRKVQKVKHSTSKDEVKREAQQLVVIQAHVDYVQRTSELIAKAKITLTLDAIASKENVVELAEIEGFIVHAERQMEQIERRVVQGKKILHSEKVFSIFEPHTEWISKGKAGVPVELGLRVCILEDHYGFILHHHVMEKTTDDQVAVSMVTESQARFPDLKSCSFDKGFHSPANQQDLKMYLDLVVLPKKGRLNKQEQKREYSEDFQAARRQHSAVESAINALEVHGLDICPDHGIDGFKRYVSMAVLARNMQKLGAELRKRDPVIERIRFAA
jgi:hypothetical protein